MGIFSRRRAVVAVWEPVPESEPEVVDADEMGDDGCAGEHAYGVTFTLSTAPDATLAVWTYACSGDPAYGGFEIGYRYEYRAGEWVSVDYESLGQGFDDLDDADDVARQVAELLIWPGRSRRNQRRYPFRDDDEVVLVEALDGLAGFGWDGVADADSGEWEEAS